MWESRKRRVWTFSSPQLWSMINVVIIYSYRLIELLINGNEIGEIFILLCYFVLILKSWHFHSNIAWRRRETFRPWITSTVDHVALVRFVQRPTVVLAVVQVMPAACLSNAANTHLQTHTKHNTFTWASPSQENTCKKIWYVPTSTMSKAFSPETEKKNPVLMDKRTWLRASYPEKRESLSAGHAGERQTGGRKEDSLVVWEGAWAKKREEVRGLELDRPLQVMNHDDEWLGNRWGDDGWEDGWSMNGRKLTSCCWFILFLVG